MKKPGNEITSIADIDATFAARRSFLIKAGLASSALTAVGTSHATSGATTQAPASIQHSHTSARLFQCANEPKRLRKSFYDLTDAEVRRLCRAVGYMRSGSKDKPLSIANLTQWDQWVMMHAKHCTEAAPGTQDQVHWSWFFLPWHRAYLWFLERLLANILTVAFDEDGSKFSLPYWDWTSHQEMPNTRERAGLGLNSPLFGYDLSMEDMVNADSLGFDNQALWNGYRKPSIQQPTMDPANEVSKDAKDHIAETIEYMKLDSIRLMLLLEFEDFAGRAVAPQSTIPTPDGMGILEHYPHNNGHDWVGSRFGKNRDMGSLRYAALDPIFFMHHANIDRIWSLYRREQPDPDKAWGSNKYIWGNQRYTFLDIDGSSVILTVSDIVKCLTNVTYAEPQATEAPAVSILSTPIQDQLVGSGSVTTLFQGSETLTGKPLIINRGAQLELNSTLDEKQTFEPGALSLLVIETGPISYPGKFMIKVFINKPDASQNTRTSDPQYVGRIRALDSESRLNERGSDVTHTFLIMLRPGAANVFRHMSPSAPLSVTLVPSGPSAGDEKFRVEVKSIRLKIVGGH